MTTTSDLPPLPSRELLSLGLPWTARRMVAYSEMNKTNTFVVVETVSSLLQFLYKVAGMEWVHPRDVKDPTPDPDEKQIAEYRRWLIPMVREVATMQSFCIDGPEITKKMFDDTGIDVFAIDGLDILGYDREGFNRYGFNSAGMHRDGRMKSTGLNVVQEKYDREGGEEPVYSRSTDGSKSLNESGYGADGLDAEGYDEKGYDLSRVDRWGNLESDVSPLSEREILEHYQVVEVPVVDLPVDGEKV